MMNLIQPIDVRDSDKFAFSIIANTIRESRTMEGGYRIFIELSKRWIAKGHRVLFFTSSEEGRMIRRYIPVGDCCTTRTPAEFGRLAYTSVIMSILFFSVQTFFGFLSGIKIAQVENKRPIVWSPTPFLPDL